MSNGALRLENRVAFVTGAAHGIGRAIAQAFGSEGAAVACVDIREQAVSTVARDIEAKGARARASYCDVTDGASLERAIEDTVESFGRLTTLVCNAATFTDLAPIDELEEEEWRRALDVNLTGVFLTAKMGVPHLRAHGGSIILIASQMGRVASPGQSAYCATKGALLQLAKVMALDLAPDGIRVNTLSPGAVATERLARRFGSMEAAEREMAPKHPINRLGRPEEVASAAVFLASDESSFMTGADLLIDGGYSAW